MGGRMVMTTPRDAIAGLIERLREDIAQLVTAISQAKFSGPRTGVRVKDPSALMDDLTDAATQLDSLLKEREALRNEINDWANEVARYKSYAEKFDQENAALQARVKELEGFVLDEQLSHGRTAKAAREEVARLQQERDEAYERAAKVADRLASDRRKRELDAGFSPATARPAAQAYWCEEIGDAIRRLAGPEKS